MNRGDSLQKWIVVGMLFALLPLCSGCIDDNMSDCNNFTVRYRIELTTQSQAFSGVMEVLDMHFYDSNKALAYYEHVEKEQMPSDNIYKIMLPISNYHHFAIANIREESCVKSSDIGIDPDKHKLGYHSTADTVPSHGSELYIGRAQFTIADKDEFVEVVLTPCIAMTRLHLDYETGVAASVDRIEGYINKTATGFYSKDSIYEYERPVVVQMNEAGEDENGLSLYQALSFPSQDEASVDASAGTRSITEENALWNTDVYVTMGDKITRNTIHLADPLPAGECVDIYGLVRGDGSIEIGHNLNATVAVTIDWKPGGNIDIEM